MYICQYLVNMNEQGLFESEYDNKHMSMTVKHG